MEGQNDDWQPLESNPEVINTFIAKLGLRTDLYNFQELLSKQQWALQMILQPVLGVILLFEQTPIQNQFKKKQQETLKPQQIPKNVFFMKQFAENACGTIALFHIIMNSSDQYQDLIKEDSYLHKFKSTVSHKDPKEIGQIFKQSKELKQEHQVAVHQGQSNVNCSTNAHFISFAVKNQTLYEFDGCKKCPVNHGHCSKAEVLNKSIQVINQFIKRDPQNLNFSMIVLARAPQ